MQAIHADGHGPTRERTGGNLAPWRYPRVTPPATSPRRRGARASSGDIVTEDWGCVGYEEALARQLALHARRVAGDVPDTLVLVSHPATFTLGRQAPEADIVLDRSELERRGIAVARSDRGGRATYHGPGQVVLYPIVSVADLGLGTKDWVCLLESALIDTLADYGVQGHRRPATAGIWTTRDASAQPGTAREDASTNRCAAEVTTAVPARFTADRKDRRNDLVPAGGEAGSKIASLGLRVSRGVNYHGVALNTGLDASVFDCIVTCGVRGESVTTIAAATGVRPDDAEVGMRLAGHVERRILEARSRTSGAGSCETPA